MLTFILIFVTVEVEAVEEAGAVLVEVVLGAVLQAVLMVVKALPFKSYSCQFSSISIIMVYIFICKWFSSISLIINLNQSIISVMLQLPKKQRATLFYYKYVHT